MVLYHTRNEHIENSFKKQYQSIYNNIITIDEPTTLVEDAVYSVLLHPQENL
jgi:hypothetical protein